MFSFFGSLIDGILSTIIGFVLFIITLPLKIIGWVWHTLGFILGLALKPFLAIWFLFFPAPSSNSVNSASIESKSPAIVQVQKVTHRKSQNQHSSPGKSDYYKVRQTLAASEFLDDVVSKFPIASSSPYGVAARGAANLTKVGIYAEDWIHTDREIEARIQDILTSRKLANASKYPEEYNKFQEYVRISLKKWVPDRDYPTIGYLPKDLLYDRSLGEEEITKYWPEATQRDRQKYVALTLDELVKNYELVWQTLLRQS
ncbi:MAG: hypothetical protein ACLFT0_00415 [Spirulinaceae cyanobacterium]